MKYLILMAARHDDKGLEIADCRLQIEELKVSGVGCQVSGKKNKKAEIRTRKP
jgi:hypothetical protein